MSDLIEALQIFLKYGNPTYPTHCEHDILHVVTDPKLVSIEDRARLAELSFHVYEDGFASFRFGSA